MRATSAGLGASGGAPPGAAPAAGSNAAGSADVDLCACATTNVRHILDIAIEHPTARAAIVVSDARCELARIVSGAYRVCLPAATHLSFDALSPQAIMDAFSSLSAGDLVVLVQSTSFRLEKFRIRVELFKRGLKVIEHPHLERMQPAEYPHYIDALAYDPSYYRVIGAAIKRRIDAASVAVVESGGGERLLYESGFEPAKMNVGDYAGLKNVGGQFPIGEVFTEPRDLERVNGRVRIFAFGDTAFRVNRPPRPITLIIDRGKVTGTVDSTPELDQVIASIKTDEEVWVRELGFGMNRALTRERVVSDVGTFERMCGIHLSLGAKHGVYNKPNLRRKDARHHVDVFVLTETVQLDGALVFRDGAWLV